MFAQENLSKIVVTVGKINYALELCLLVFLFKTKKAEVVTEKIDCPKTFQVHRKRTRLSKMLRKLAKKTFLSASKAEVIIW